VTDIVGPGSLKLVLAWGPPAGALERALTEHAGEADVRPLPGGVVLVHTETDCAALRDLVVRALGRGAGVFVVEFERWSGFGPGVDARWLLRRGH
jgi:hypothetical protein